jgi:gamma-glutamylcyclotransferase (GGCT)/AIG2-like uncharacterized protein YtfP
MRLFFYGTLMSDEVRGSVLGGLARRVGDATISGDLYDVGYFPALVPTDSDGRVCGEVWEVLPGYGPSALAITDRIEGYREGDPRSMYVRERVEALLATGERVEVETYRWNSSTAHMARIEGGSWKSYRRAAILPMGVA